MRKCAVPTRLPIDVTYDRLFEFEGTIEAVYREELGREVDRSGRAAGLDVLNGPITAQGLIVHTTQFGDMPWWPACWPWLSKATRALTF